MSDRNRRALSRAYELRADAEQDRRQRVTADEASHEAVSRAIFVEARRAADHLEKLGFPGVQVVKYSATGGWFRRGKTYEMGGWMVYDLGDGGDRSDSTKVYLLSDGRIKIAGGDPNSETEALVLTPGHATELLRRLQGIAISD